MRRAVVVLISIVIGASTASADLIVEAGEVESALLGRSTYTQQTPVNNTYTTGVIDETGWADTISDYTVDGITQDFTWHTNIGTNIGASHTGEVFFEVDIDSDFTLDGFFFLDHPEAASLEWLALLLGPDGFRVVYDMDSDELIGTLTAGVSYYFYTKMTIEKKGSGLAMIDGTGNFTLSVVPVPEPEPGKAAGIVLGVLGLILLGEHNRDDRGH